MNQAVSIIVPIFNVASHIEKCAHSLFNQTLTDIEYIFIDDASTDNSVEILKSIIEKYPERKKHIKLQIHKNNVGPSETRNEALKISTGDYISLIDSDDYIDLEMIEVLYKKAKYDDSDIVVSDIWLEYKTKSVYKVDFLSDDKEIQFRDMIVNKVSQGYLCNKLIKRSLFNYEDCQFTSELKYLEDKLLSIKLYYFSNNISKINQAFYHYIQYNDNSITKNKSSIHFENVLLFWEMLEKFLFKNGELNKFKSKIDLLKIVDKVHLLIETHSCLLRKEYSKMFYNEETMYLSYFKRGEKLMLLLVRYKMFAIAQLFHNYLIFKHKRL